MAPSGKAKVSTRGQRRESKRAGTESSDSSSERRVVLRLIVGEGWCTGERQREKAAQRGGGLTVKAGETMVRPDVLPAARRPRTSTERHHRGSQSGWPGRENAGAGVRRAGRRREDLERGVRAAAPAYTCSHLDIERRGQANPTTKRDDRARRHMHHHASATQPLSPQLALALPNRKLH